MMKCGYRYDNRERERLKNQTSRLHSVVPSRSFDSKYSGLLQYRQPSFGRQGLAFFGNGWYFSAMVIIHAVTAAKYI